MGVMSEVGSLVGGGFSKLAQYSWIFIILMVVALIVGVLYWLSIARKKKHQWTHSIKVRRKFQDGTLSGEEIHKARRFPGEKGIELFELDRPILGSFLMPQPGEYTGPNQFSIVLDSWNRIYLNKGEKFNQATQSTEVSCVHAGIDIEFQNMKSKWQEAHRVDKKITTAELITAGLKALGIVALVIIGIVALQQWGEAQQYKAQSEQAKAEAMKHIGEAVQLMEKVVNTQQLQLVPMLEALYGTENIAEEINKYREDSEIEGS